MATISPILITSLPGPVVPLLGCAQAAPGAASTIDTAATLSMACLFFCFLFCISRRSLPGRVLGLGRAGVSGLHPGSAPTLPGCAGRSEDCAWQGADARA